MAQATCRLPDGLANAFDEAAAEAGLFRSEIYRRALRHYVKANPDQLQAFAEQGGQGHRDSESDANRALQDGAWGGKDPYYPPTEH